MSDEYYHYEGDENGLLSTIYFHDVYDLLFLGLLASKVVLHVHETYRLFAHRHFIDNQAKPIIVYLHITSIAIIIDNYLWIGLIHEGGLVIIGTLISKFMIISPDVYIKGFRLYCYVFESHLTIFVCISFYALIGQWKETSSYEVFRYYNFPILSMGVILPAMYMILVWLVGFRHMTPYSIEYSLPVSRSGIPRQEDFRFYSNHLLFIDCGLLLIAVSECVQLVLIIVRDDWSRIIFRLAHLALALITWMLVPEIEIEDDSVFANLTGSFTLYSCFILFLVQVLGQPLD